MSYRKLQFRITIARIVRDLVRLRADQRGNVAVMMGFLLPVLIGSFGIGFEVAIWYLNIRAMQNAADSAAIAAGANASPNAAVEANAVAAQYGFVNGTNNVTVTVTTIPTGTAPCPSGGSTCYSVQISNAVPLFLSQVVGYRGDTTVNGAYQKTLSSTAVARQTTIQQPLCLLALPLFVQMEDPKRISQDAASCLTPALRATDRTCKRRMA
jgi:Flp pilus assembly protein TadG